MILFNGPKCSMNLEVHTLQVVALFICLVKDHNEGCDAGFSTFPAKGGAVAIILDWLH
jgi:hypothetical protein